MDDQRVGRAAGVFDACDIAALQAVTGIGGGVLIGHLGLGITLQPDPQPRLVHHGEHGAHALVQLAQQVAGGAVIVHHAGGIAVDPHLFLDLADRYRVLRAKAAIGVDEEFRHDEQRNAPGPFAATRGLGQHQMHDVGGQVVVARRDEDLLPADGIAAIRLRQRFGAHQAQIGAAMGFGQVHRAGPVARHHRRQVGCLLRRGAVGMDRRIGAMGQALIHVEGHVGRHEHLSHCRAQHIGHALATIGRVAIQPHPAARLHLVIGGLEAGGGAHHAVFQPTPLTVTDLVQRGQHFGGQFASLTQYGGGKVTLQLVIARDAGGGDIQHLMKQELQVFDGGLIGRHRQPLG